jgi:hypothetical protein
MTIRWPWTRHHEIEQHSDRVDEVEPVVEAIHDEARHHVRENHIGPLLESLFVAPPAAPRTPGGTKHGHQ